MNEVERGEGPPREILEGKMRDDVLVSTAWVSDHLNDPKVRIAEVDVDTAAYDQGHVPGAVGWNWTTQLCDTVVRDVIPKAQARRAAQRVRNWQRHHGCLIWRQQQLVRRLGVLAVKTVRTSGCPHHGRRPQEVARGREGAQHRSAEASEGGTTKPRIRTIRFARTCRK